jgi:REP element-mobilizing transposase RayT
VREKLSGREPVLVTMKLRAGITSLRTRSAFARVLDGLLRARERLGSRITHFSVQRDHVHLVIETWSTPSLSRAMKGLAVRIARAVNRTMNRRGAVFADRFHDRVLRTPRQVRHALAYVLCNARKHGVAPSRRGWLDPFSSAAAFDGWMSRHVEAVARVIVATPATWLLRVGWRRGGLLDPDHRPGALR